MNMQTGEISDGYHTFDELYEHRTVLFLAVCRFYANQHGPGGVWRSLFHSDGGSYDGWFIMGIHKERGQQITYHLPMSKWKDANFAETLETAPQWDGHTPADVVERLKRIQ